MNGAWVFERNKRFKEGRESVRDDARCGWSKEVNTPAKGLGLGLLYWVLREFRKRFRWKRPTFFKSGQWHFHQDNAPVHNSILVTDYLTKMGIKTVPHPVPIVQTLLPVTFAYSLSSRKNLEAVVWYNWRDCDEGHWQAHTRGLAWSVPEVVGIV